MICTWVTYRFLARGDQPAEGPGCSREGSRGWWRL